MALARRLVGGERAALARAISLVESTAPHARPAADALLTEALRTSAAASAAVPYEKKNYRAEQASARLRIGISGTPGAGKSTLIEALGAELVARGHLPAVLAVDPSSSRSGGSVLGDKTRKPGLAAESRAFVRPSPARGNLGGVARRTHDVLCLVEAAGYDRVIVETVGVGQSEAAVRSLVDSTHAKAPYAWFSCPLTCPAFEPSRAWTVFYY